MIRLVLLLTLLGTSAFAQTSGYLGKRMYTMWNIYSFPSVRYQQLPSHKWNIKNGASIGYVLTKTVSIEAQGGVLSTTIPYATSDTIRRLITNDQVDDHFLRMNSYYAGLRLKAFLPRVSGAIAPFGLYAAAAVQHHWTFIYEPALSSGAIKEQFGGYRLGWMKGIAANLEIGNQWLFYDRYFIDIGLQTGLFFSTEYRHLNELKFTDVRTKMKSRIFNHNGFNIKLGFGMLLR